MFYYLVDMARYIYNSVAHCHGTQNKEFFTIFVTTFDMFSVLGVHFPRCAIW
jgi:hypothetical protein